MPSWWGHLAILGLGPRRSLNEPLLFRYALQMHYVIISSKNPKVDIINPIFQTTIVATSYRPLPRSWAPG